MKVLVSSMSSRGRCVAIVLMGIYMSLSATGRNVMHVDEPDCTTEYIKDFNEIGIEDIPLVGGKNASLGEMIVQLTSKGIRVPHGFALTVAGYHAFLEHNNLKAIIAAQMEKLTDVTNLTQLRSVGKAIRSAFMEGVMPVDLSHALRSAYQQLCTKYGVQDLDVAVRSSATAEDLPDASFAGQQDTFLNISGYDNLEKACKECFASLFNDRAIAYRVERNFEHHEVALSIGVQRMVRSDRGVAGVMFTLDTESGFKDLVMINAAYGLGEAVVQGSVNPDEFRVFKTTLEQGHAPIVRKVCGRKNCKIIYGPTGSVQTVPVDAYEQNIFTLTDQQVLELAGYAVTIEKHYTQKRGAWTPMDIEWALDGVDGKLYILQARPETVHSQKSREGNSLVQYAFNGGSIPCQDDILVTGQSIGSAIAQGAVRIIQNIESAGQFKQGDILVTDMTDPDWVPLMKKASAIITNRGGRTCHAAIVSRELGIAALVGTENATRVLKEGQEVTVDCSQGNTGYVYSGLIPFTKTEVAVSNLAQPAVSLYLNIADPDRAFTLSRLPAGGVGLARMEFIISNMIKIHPMAALFPERVLDKAVLEGIDDAARAYKDAPTYFVDTLAQGVGSIAAAFYPRPVIVRLSDFKSNEYRNLVGGVYFEPEEENPMLGLRGASRYYHEMYAPAFRLECEALCKVRDTMGLTNVKVMLPFVRTVKEAQTVLDIMAQYGLARGKNGLEVVMMCEIPSNVILIDQFSKLFDGFSIGSNDLTQTTLAVDRDSGLLTSLFDERDPAVMKMLYDAVTGAKRNNVYIGICGQAPSDHPDIGEFLIKAGIDSLSLNPDSLIPFMMRGTK